MDRSWERRELLALTLATAVGAFTGSRAWAQWVQEGVRQGPAASARPRRHDRQARFDLDYPEDVRVGPREFDLLRSVAARLVRVRGHVGYGNFNFLGFDGMVATAKKAAAVGSFPAGELQFLERLFAVDARSYGFLGEKVLTELTSNIPREEIVSIRGTGHYLFRGEPLEHYQRIQQDVGPTLLLTSGVRGVAKQFQLFLSKAVRTRGNLSRASRSLAPPGYSFHGAGDFDVGQVGAGLHNFSSLFARTPEYQRMLELGYVNIRYGQRNPYGVRFEPWHIQV